MAVSAVSLYDKRPFFEKALVYGVQQGLIDQAKLDAIATDAPKGMVQIARYFGSEFLRPEIEKAKDRIVNLVSLYLESSCAGDLHKAAESLRDHSFMSRSKAGSDMLKALIAMPQSSHFGMNEHGGFRDEHIPQLAKWSLRSLADYQAELAARSQVAQVVDAAMWMADALGLSPDELEEAGADAQAIIRTALLAQACKRVEMPNWVEFEKMIATLRKKHAVSVGGTTIGGDESRVAAAKSDKSAASALQLNLPKNLPPEYKLVVESARKSILADLPKLLDPALPARKLFSHTPAFVGRYFWLEDPLSEVDHYDRAASAAWAKATGGHHDDSSLLTLFLCIASGAPAKTLLTEKAALSLIRKIRKTGLQSELAVQYIQAHAPSQDQEDCILLWKDFWGDAQATLQSDYDYALQDALALLVRNCNVK
jgi:hypothetical protein